MIPVFFNPSSSSASRTPAQILANTSLWLRGNSIAFSTAAASQGSQSPPNSGNTVRTWISPIDTWVSPALRYAEQPTAGTRPTCTIASAIYTANAASGKYFAPSSTLSLTGDFVLWAVIKTDRSAVFHVCGAAGTPASINIDTVGRIFFNQDAGSNSFSSTGAVATSTRTLIRVRRVSNTVYFAASGYAETSPGTNSGTYTLNRILSGAGATTAVVAEIGEILVSTNTTDATSPPSAIDGSTGWFKTGQYGSDTAWGLSI